MTHPFFSPSHTSLKVCGVTLEADAYELVKLGVPAVGINFWPMSKRYLDPFKAGKFLPSLTGKILRVGVFVNAEPTEVLSLLESKLIDAAQFHGDESPEYCAAFADAGYPFNRALGVKDAGSLGDLLAYRATAILLDAHAPGIYGGTGNCFDWSFAKNVIAEYPELPIMLAGGITFENAEEATRSVQPTALDIASGSESSPGIKDFDKICAIQRAIAIGSQIYGD